MASVIARKWRSGQGLTASLNGLNVTTLWAVRETCVSIGSWTGTRRRPRSRQDHGPQHTRAMTATAGLACVCGAQVAACV
jgi:hypothetical protein